MKKFKLINSHFVCEECREMFLYKKTLSLHLNKKHNSKEYFDKWIKEENDDKCKICNNKTQFLNIGKGYKNCCCESCSKKYNYQQTEKTCLSKYGVKNANVLITVKEKIKKTNLKKYGNASPAQNNKVKEKIKKTCLERYGVDHPFKSDYCKTRRIEGTMNKYGVINISQLKETQRKIKNTHLKKYGVEHPMQNTQYFEKTQRNNFLAKKYKNTNIYYRGSYELDFLEKYYNKFIDIKNASSIKYMLNNKEHIYFPDFYIPSLNIIIEIKSSYYLKKYKDKCIAKQIATETQGFKYILIIDKNYSTFF